jgi:dUTP pyrophosphatase
MITVNIKKLNEAARIPNQANPGDFCYDVWAVSEEEIAPNVWRYGLGFKYEVVREPGCSLFGGGFDMFFLGSYDSSNYRLSIDLRPRSSIWKTGMVLANSIGTLDEFYRGEAMAVFYHVMPNMPRYKIGDKIGQIVLSVAPLVQFLEKDEINEDTQRGANGFGSTGKQ